MSNDHVSVTVVDRGAFPDDIVRSAHPPPKSAIDDPVDRRRFRALIVDRLESAANEGDTLRPLDRVIQDVRDLPAKSAVSGERGSDSGDAASSRTDRR